MIITSWKFPKNSFETPTSYSRNITFLPFNIPQTEHVAFTIRRNGAEILKFRGTYYCQLFDYFADFPPPRQRPCANSV